MAGPVIVKRITGVEVGRDGGSYHLFFNAMDRRAYELFIQATLDKTGAVTGYKIPILHLCTADDGDTLGEINWPAARAALAGHTLAKRNPERGTYDDLMEIIAQDGRIG